MCSLTPAVPSRWPTSTATRSWPAGTGSGNVSLTASGVASTITATVDNDVVTASRGSITLAAGQDILLGTVGTEHDNDVQASGSITFSAGRNIVIDGAADVWSDSFFNNTGRRRYCCGPQQSRYLQRRRR